MGSGPEKDGSSDPGDSTPVVGGGCSRDEESAVGFRQEPDRGCD